ncbi:MAG TPA: glycosyltransferase, partial [Candidatus Omnitrophota bacterium]|nr:glycosyltransferase [Candidatus Omnitrophota bacterium]
PCGFLPSSRVLPKPREIEDGRYGAGRLHMVFVGRYHVNKGPDLLLEALLKLREPYRKRLLVHMYGLGPLKESLESFIDEHGLRDIVEFNGAIDAQNLADVFRKVGYLIIPSRIESIPVVFSDALQSGVPVISTPVGDLKSLIEKHGCGILAEDVSADGIVHAIERACDEGHAAFALKAKQLAREFEVGQVVKKWVDL